MLSNRLSRNEFVKRMVTNPRLYKEIMALAFKDSYLMEVRHGEEMSSERPPYRLLCR